MTNREVIQLFAKYEPHLLAQSFAGCYCLGANDLTQDGKLHGNWAKLYDDADCANEWLNAEYDKCVFDDEEVERLIELNKNTKKDITIEDGFNICAETSKGGQYYISGTDTFYGYVWGFYTDEHQERAKLYTDEVVALEHLHRINDKKVFVLVPSKDLIWKLKRVKITIRKEKTVELSDYTPDTEVGE